MDKYKKIAYSSIMVGTLGLILFLLEKLNYTNEKYINYLGKLFIAIGIYLLAIAIINIEEEDKNES